MQTRRARSVAVRHWLACLSVVLAALPVHAGDGKVIAPALPNRIATPTGVPLPTPRLTAACTAQLASARSAVEHAQQRVVSAIGKRRPSGAAIRALEDDAALRSAQATCCVDYIPTVTLVGSGQGVGTSVCRGVLEPHVRSGKVKIHGSFLDNLYACIDLANAGVAAAQAAIPAQSDPIVRAAFSALAESEKQLAKVLIDCAAPPPIAQAGTQAGTVPPAAKPIGQSCTAATECATLNCQGGLCVVSGVPPLGACDSLHLCGAGLECRNSQCRLPCACPLGCFVEGGECKKNVPTSRPVFSNCARDGFGVCKAPCVLDKELNCKTVDVETGSEKQSCTRVCP